MFPTHKVRIKEEIPDEYPSEISRSPVTEMQSEFVAIKQEIEIDAQPTDLTIPPQYLNVNIKCETESATWMTSNFTVHIKQEPMPNTDIHFEPALEGYQNGLLQKVKEEPHAGVAGNNFQYASTNQLTTPTAAKVQCQLCKTLFPSLAQLESHIRTHNHDDINNKCNKCNRTFKTPQTFRAHEARGGCKPRPPLICRDCGLEFNKVFVYQSHVKIHSEIRPYHCDYCPMVFRHRRTIIKHLTTHTDDSTYACPVCKEMFYCQAAVKSHVKIHTGERPYPCPICQKTFSYKHNAQKHLLIHCREKVLTCSLCGKVFPRESRLRYHMNSHAKVKPFFCDVCRRAFSHKSNVVRHMLRKHPGLIKEGLYQTYK